MLRRTWIAIPALAVGVLMALLAGAQDTRGAQASLDELLRSNGMTQEQMTAHLLRALDYAELAPPDCVPGQEMFGDVPASNPFCPAIEEMARRGITSGCGGNNFCPTATLTRQQMAVFVVRAIKVAIEDCSEGLAPDDEMVRVGSVCVDKYEASIWDAPVGGNQITGAIPCSETGQDCDNIYALSVAGVEPRRDITWFQAQAALANSGKRLPTNAEWQMAVRGTPDHPGPCNTLSGGVQTTGANAGCTSAWGAFDMVGNIYEWVADWVPRSTICGDWPSGYGGDLQCLAGAGQTGTPSALIRGGRFNDGAFAGPFTVDALTGPSVSDSSIGFRGAR